jgi:hypothetical protein
MTLKNVRKPKTPRVSIANIRFLLEGKNYFAKSFIVLVPGVDI